MNTTWIHGWSGHTRECPVVPLIERRAMPDPFPECTCGAEDRWREANAAYRASLGDQPAMFNYEDRNRFIDAYRPDEVPRAALRTTKEGRDAP